MWWTFTKVTRPLPCLSASTFDVVSFINSVGQTAVASNFELACSVSSYPSLLFSLKSSFSNILVCQELYKQGQLDLIHCYPLLPQWLSMVLCVTVLISRSSKFLFQWKMVNALKLYTICIHIIYDVTHDKIFFKNEYIFFHF